MNLKSKVWSNLFLLVPVLISLYFHLFFQAMLIFSLIIFSSLYHFYEEKRFDLIDKISIHTNH